MKIHVTLGLENRRWSARFTLLKHYVGLTLNKELIGVTEPRPFEINCDGMSFVGFIKYVKDTIEKELGFCPTVEFYDEKDNQIGRAFDRLIKDVMAEG